MKKMVALAIVMAGVVTYGLQRTPPAASKNSPFNEQRVDTDLRTIVGFGPRPAGSEAITKTRNYIVSELKKTGLAARLDEFDARTPRGFRHMVNIRATRPGSKPATIAVT